MALLIAAVWREASVSASSPTCANQTSRSSIEKSSGMPLKKSNKQMNRDRLHVAKEQGAEKASEAGKEW
jgi:hypothetical protein